MADGVAVQPYPASVKQNIGVAGDRMSGMFQTAQYCPRMLKAVNSSNLENYSKEEAGGYKEDLQR